MFHVKQSDRDSGRRTSWVDAMPSLFHVKQWPGKRRRAVLLLALVAAVPLLLACDVADQPDGWAAPTLDPVEPETRLIAPTGEDQVVAVQLLDGNLGSAVWEFPDDDGNFPGLDGEIEPVAFYADPVWVESTDEWLLAGYSDGALYAVRRDGESARLVFDSEDRFVADLVVDGTRVYLADTGYRVYAVDIEQPGEAVWTWDGGSDLQIWGGPALVDTERGRLLIVAGLDGRITAINVDGDLAGRSAWQIEIESGIAGSIGATDGLVFVGGLDRTLYGLDAATGAQIWATEASHWLWGTPLIRDGVIYTTDLRGNVYAIDALTGARRWLQPFAVGDRIRAQPLYVEHESGESGILVIVARGGMIHQLNATDGSPLRQFQLEGAKDLMANAILRDDRILVSDEDGVLYAVLLGANQAVRLYPQN
ncbi:MAG: PQQ-binding-like beta-propeller repeat protein [Chloroflexi bacterium]|nr:PQQ-binding-like beta-propeller repeat protein [Chloroflexota bacterium]MYJ58823.1 PQQ-binding-like beta-propeller repeat protein [Chloroflexota bacterium]